MNTIIGKHLALAVVVLVLTACSVSADDYIEVYEDGTDKVGEALTKKELAQITIDVQGDIKDLQNRIGANNSKFSEEEYRKIFDTQNKFYDAVEKRDKELSKYNPINFALLTKKTKKFEKFWIIRKYFIHLCPRL